ncbi:hypothetical protein K466DRAFT_331372 [Polyporus arcularius HHB13444]|uniref:F-box domain-containing protein n=1 Tax=Polyporus arcularius HHB13444 TaxID=1314778 RepID=A0A5C3NYL4_9APHY|nr:hypothetical protein K466DRAFT_331372 [Polyporus arcularius HHB13444]
MCQYGDLPATPHDATHRSSLCPCAWSRTAQGAYSFWFRTVRALEWFATAVEGPDIWHMKATMLEDLTIDNTAGIHTGTLRKIAGFMSSLRELHMKGCNPDHVQEFLINVPPQAPLQHLSLPRLPYNLHEIPCWPGVRTLELLMGGDEPDATVPNPFPSLTHLKLHGSHWYEIDLTLQLLRISRSPQLVSLSVALASCVPLYASNQRGFLGLSIRFSNLKYLEVDETGYKVDPNALVMCMEPRDFDVASWKAYFPSLETLVWTPPNDTLIASRGPREEFYGGIFAGFSWRLFDGWESLKCFRGGIVVASPAQDGTTCRLWWTRRRDSLCPVFVPRCADCDGELWRTGREEGCVAEDTPIVPAVV